MRAGASQLQVAGKGVETVARWALPTPGGAREGTHSGKPFHHLGVGMGAMRRNDLGRGGTSIAGNSPSPSHAWR